MAIQLDLQTSNYGVPFSGAYFRVVTASIGRQRGATFSVMLDVVGYASRPLNEDTRDVDFRRYHVPLLEIEAQNGTAFLEKSYNWVIQQPDMAGAVGV
jgi:hypothetical protein